VHSRAHHGPAEERVLPHPLPCPGVGAITRPRASALAASAVAERIERVPQVRVRAREVAAFRIRFLGGQHPREDLAVRLRALSRARKEIRRLRRILREIVELRPRRSDVAASVVADRAQVRPTVVEERSERFRVRARILDLRARREQSPRERSPVEASGRREVKSSNSVGTMSTELTTSWTRLSRASEG
jgi:hypothetical protein